jgi:hypothetical protein
MKIRIKLDLTNRVRTRLYAGAPDFAPSGAENGGPFGAVFT